MIKNVKFIKKEKIVLEIFKIKSSQIFLRTFGAPGGTRTPGLELRRLAFYPAKLQTHIFFHFKGYNSNEKITNKIYSIGELLGNAQNSKSPNPLLSR